MSVHWIIPILLFAVAIDHASAQQLPPPELDEREAAEARARALERFRSENPRKVPHVSMPLRELLTDRDFDVLMGRARLTPEQEQFAKVHFKAYRDRSTERFDDDLRDLYQRSNAVSKTKPILLDEVASLFEDAHELDKRLGAVEQQWFEAVRAILVEQQQHLWDRCVHARQRDCSLSVRRAFPGLTVDLSELDLDAYLDEATRFTPLDQNMWMEFWLRYDRDMTPLYERYAKAYRLYSPQASEIHYQAMDETEPEQAMAVLEEAAKKRDEYIDIARRIHDRNDAFATEAEGLLRPEDGRRWNVLVKGLFYPEIYPLPFDVDLFLTDLLARDDWTTQEREELSEIASMMRLRVEQIESELLRGHLDWITKSERLSTLFHAEAAEHREDMARVQRQRLEVIRDTAASIEEYDAALAADVRATLDHLDSADISAAEARSVHESPSADR